MRERGWRLIDPISDFGRMGIPNRYWAITDANRNYEICSTYPPEIVVPKSVSLGTVVGSSKFRSKERVPVLSYLYKENNAAICRCSQPLSGFYTRCIDDELLLEAISQTNPGSQFMYVVDTRPKLNAIANRAAGKGYENEDNYANIRFRFMGIENIHVMRSSVQKLLEVCELKTPTMSEFLSGLESSGWLRHIKAVMDAGIFIAKVENVKLLDRCVGKKPANGSLYLTATHLIYVEASGAARKETWIALHHIATVERLPITTLGCPLILHCKNFRVAHFVLESDVVCHEIYISLLKLSRPALPEDLYAFSYNPKSSKKMRERGWRLIDPISDFGRMGIPNRYWAITDANRNYEICSTYPPEIVVPKSVSLGTVVGSSKFRSKERVPVLSYLYKENNAAICRCSQPLSGFYTRCIDDELLLEAISQTNPGSQFMYVVDTRPKLNAIANRAAGKGYENEDNYANIRFRFMGIENIHVMRSSVQKLLEVCELKTPTMSEFLSGLESSGWLRHIKAVMDAGIFIAKAVKVEKTNVLVHCSDGWDRTAQVCSVASILLDPFYRTFKGLMILIEKEWISMGHKFSQRCGHLDGDPKEVSPIFTQFLDCIWQLMEQFPCAFEFNENFLLEIHDHVFSCQFGNFLGNCQKDREDMRIYEKTHSLWPFLVQRKPDFRNPLYKGFTVYGVLNPSTVPYNIQFWCGMYNRFDKGLQPKQSMLESLLQIKKQRTVLEANVHKLEKKLKGHDESPEEVCSCSQLGNLLSQHLGSPLSSPLGFMGVDGDFSTLMENGTLSREGSLQVQLDQVKSQWEYLHHDCCGIMDNLRAINISGDVGFSGDRGISGNTGTSEAIGFYGDISISEDMSFSGSMVISEDTGLSKASTKGADCSKHQ